MPGLPRVHVKDTIDSRGHTQCTGTYLQKGLINNRVQFMKLKDECDIPTTQEEIQESDLDFKSTISWDPKLPKWKLVHPCSCYTCRNYATLGGDALPTTENSFLIAVPDVDIEALNSTISTHWSSPPSLPVPFSISDWWNAPQSDATSTLGSVFTDKAFGAHGQCHLHNNTAGTLHIVEERIAPMISGRTRASKQQNGAGVSADVGSIKTKEEAAAAAATGVPVSANAHAEAGMSNQSVNFEREVLAVTYHIHLVGTGMKKVFSKAGATEVKLHMQRHGKGCLGADIATLEWGKIITVTEDVVPRDSIDPKFLEAYQRQRDRHLELEEKAAKCEKKQLVDYDDTTAAKHLIGNLGEGPNTGTGRPAIKRERSRSRSR